MLLWRGESSAGCYGARRASAGCCGANRESTTSSFISVVGTILYILSVFNSPILNYLATDGQATYRIDTIIILFFPYYFIFARRDDSRRTELVAVRRKHLLMDMPAGIIPTQRKENINDDIYIGEVICI